MANLNTEDKQNLTNNVCNELLKKGIKPTVSLVLAELPTISSRSTVHKYFKVWTDEQNLKKEENFKKLGFSSEFTSTVLNEISRFNCDAEARYIEQAQYANEQRDHAISDLQNSENKVNEQSNLIKQQEEKISNLQTDLATEHKSNKSIIIEIRRQLTTSIDDNKQLSKQNESLRADISKSELKLESNQQLVDEIKSQNSQLIVDNKELNSNIAEINRSIASKESTITGNEKLIKTLENEQEKTGKQLISFDSNNEKLQSALASVRNELSNCSIKASEEKDKLGQQITLNTELKSNIEKQARSHEKALINYQATIASHEKLIAQLEKK
ncbi:MAG: DNA-binding protein [Colwellia polaris]|jgi:chromosome segregation ATPase|tara:strand:+ start:1636 stop:2619 length:984 start_codon:yes stop_codon:yes gene_type:complete